MKNSKFLNPLFLSIFILLVSCNSKKIEPDTNKSVKESASFIAAPETKWRNTNDIINGWDWSLPENVNPIPYSGISMPWPLVNGKRYDLRGNEIIKVRTTWRDLEPTEGNFDFESLKEKILEASSDYDGVLLNIRASVYDIINFPEHPNADYPENWLETQKVYNNSAPKWLEKYNINTIPGRPRFNLKTPFQIINYNVFQDEYHSRYLKFLDALGKSGIPQMEKVKFVYLHFASGSRGEEGEGLGVPMTESDKIKFRERLKAWADAFKGVEYKLTMVVGAGDDVDYAYSLGTGQRNGFVDMIFQTGENKQLGQRINKDDYLEVDESLPPIAENRAFGDENEEYTDLVVPRFGPMETFEHRYRESMLRVLQMRRNFVWIEPNMINSELANYVSLELGRNVSNTPDIWCYLRESYINDNNKSPRKVKNFERWLYQRDSKGHIAAPTAKVYLPDQLSFHHKDYKYDFTARTTAIETGNNAIGFAIDGRFLFGKNRAIAIKITYHDIGKSKWSLVYNEGNSSRQISCWGSGDIRTATFFIEDANFSAENMNYDFIIRADSGNAVIKFVRVIKL